MVLINEIVEGGLSKKQHQALETKDVIIRAFYDTQNERTPRTWNALLEITGLSRGALSKHLKELVRQGVVEGYVKVYHDRLTTFYEYTEKFFRLKGKIPPGEIRGNVCQIEFRPDGLYAKWGHMKKGKHGSTYFVAEK